MWPFNWFKNRKKLERKRARKRKILLFALGGSSILGAGGGLGVALYFVLNKKTPKPAKKSIPFLMNTNKPIPSTINVGYTEDFMCILFCEGYPNDYHPDNFEYVITQNITDTGRIDYIDTLPIQNNDLEVQLVIKKGLPIKSEAYTFTIQCTANGDDNYETTVISKSWSFAVV